MVERTLRNILNERIMLLDGAMGTFIQNYKLTEQDFRGEQFKNWNVEIKGNNDILSISRPDIIQHIHSEYMDAGADIIETNTFSAQAISMKDYDMDDKEIIYQINYCSAKLAKQKAEKFTKQNPQKPRFVAGALGPTNRTLSLSPDVNNPGYRAVTFDEVKTAYYQQLDALIDGGIDLVMIETIFDTLNAKAAICAYIEVQEKKNVKLPLMISVTITDASGRTLSGQTLDAFYYTIEYAKPLIVGINCALGAEQMIPYLEALNNISSFYISCYPNAGLPNSIGEYDELPEDTARYMDKMMDKKLVNLVGGCCGTTKKHIEAMATLIKGREPRKLRSA